MLCSDASSLLNRAVKGRISEELEAPPAPPAAAEASLEARASAAAAAL